MNLFSRFFGTDDEKVLLDRRLFLKGATVTASGLILPRSIISIPAVVEPQWTIRYDSRPDGTTFSWLKESGFEHEINFSLVYALAT